MMTGNGADIECYADRENQSVQMAVRFWIARNIQLQTIQRAELFRQSAFLLFDIRAITCHHLSNDSPVSLASPVSFATLIGCFNQKEQ
ncbi:hypothetical protein [Escherichia coli]|uniref:hypothetical protein n=1 Tax=Escherichia coli TaxID=562 RepID=UPI0007518F16|nr:hypothetical protein [Escherichia coli]KUT98053.1 hypothetical protein AWF12_13540 [Escherichia coli]